MKKTGSAAWIRLVILCIALLNQALVLLGYSPIPLEDSAVEEFISLGFVIVAALVAGWKNNDVTEDAKLKKELGVKELEKIKVMKAVESIQNTHSIAPVVVVAEEKIQCVICMKEIELLDSFNGELMCYDCYVKRENEVFNQ